MPLCGFNEKMLRGLAMFNEGLIEHGLIYRSGKNGETIDAAIKREIADMTRFLLELHRLDDGSKRVFTEGLVKYAMGFYLLVRKHGVEDAYETIKRINDYCYFMDDKYYSELEGSVDDMVTLTHLLNEMEL